MYLRWNDERVFQSIWEKEDGSALVFFSNVIQDIQAYVHNWMTWPAANIHWFLIKKGRDKEDVNNTLKKCFIPEELVKIDKVSYLQWTHDSAERKISPVHDGHGS